MTTIKELFDSMEDLKKKYFDSIPKPRYECPSCGNPIKESDYKTINGELFCNICETTELKKFKRVEY